LGSTLLFAWAAIGASDLVNALKTVVLPDLGKPMSPILIPFPLYKNHAPKGIPFLGTIYLLMK